MLLISLHICFHLHEVENIHEYLSTKKYLMIYTTSTKLKSLKILREKLETVNESISKKSETFMIFFIYEMENM